MLVKSGTWTGDGTDNRAITGVGFQPDAVFVKGGANEMVLRTSTMSGDKTKQLATSLALAADMVQTLDTDGFTIGANARVNTNATVYYYLALKDDAAGDLEVGTYTGNAADNRNITLANGMTPEAVWYMGDAASQSGWNFAGADATERSTDLATANLIQAFGAGTFQVGAGSSNTSAVVYYYLALKSTSGVSKVSSYTGNGSDNRSITGAGFQPDFAWVSRHSGTFAIAAVRFKDNVGDDAVVVTAAGSAADRIQAFESDGFQVGTLGNVNTNTAAYVYLTLKERAASGGNVTVTPGAIALSLSAPAAIPSLQVLPGVIALTGSQPAATPMLQALPGAVALSLASPAPVPTIQALPSAVALSLSLPAPTIQAGSGVTATPSAIALALSALAPTPTLQATPGAIALTLSALAATPTIQAMPGAVALLLAALAPTVSTTTTVTATPGAVALTLALLAATPGVQVTPSTVALVLAVLAVEQATTPARATASDHARRVASVSDRSV